MKSALPHLFLLALILAGCSGENKSATPTDWSAPAPGDPILQVPIGFDRLYAVVQSEPENGTLLIREVDDEGFQVPREVYLRIVDGQGKFHDSNHTVPATGPGHYHRISFQFPGTAPYVVFAECGCGLIWLENTALDPDVFPGDPALAHYVNHSFVVSYDVTQPGDVLEKNPQQDFEEYAFEADILHWSMAWRTNMHGNVSLTTPTGRELARWEVEGLQVVDGHVSNGSNPLDLGTWNLTLNGVGWFELIIRTSVLSQEIWERYGLQPPAYVG